MGKKIPHYLVMYVEKPLEVQAWLNEVYERGYELVSMTADQHSTGFMVVAEFHSNERRSQYERRINGRTLYTVDPGPGVAGDDISE